MLPFRLAKCKDNVNCVRHSQCCWCLYVCVSVRMCVCHHHWASLLRSLAMSAMPNGKSNIFAYEMSEKSKHGGSLARAESKKQAKRFPV